MFEKILNGSILIALGQRVCYG